MASSIRQVKLHKLSANMDIIPLLQLLAVAAASLVGMRLDC